MSALQKIYFCHDRPLEQASDQVVDEKLNKYPVT